MECVLNRYTIKKAHNFYAMHSLSFSFCQSSSISFLHAQGFVYIVKVHLLLKDKTEAKLLYWKSNSHLFLSVCAYVCVYVCVCVCVCVGVCVCVYVGRGEWKWGDCQIDKVILSYQPDGRLVFA